MVSASRSFYRTFRGTRERTVGCRFHELGNGQWDIPRLKDLLETALAQNTSFEDMEVEPDFPVLGRRRMRLNARRLHSRSGGKELILLAMEDITGLPPGGPTGASADQAGSREKT